MIVPPAACVESPVTEGGVTRIVVRTIPLRLAPWKGKQWFGFLREVGVRETATLDDITIEIFNRNGKFVDLAVMVRSE